MTGARRHRERCVCRSESAKHVLLATDRGGVLRSEDCGMTFHAVEQWIHVAPGSGLCGGSARSRAGVCGRRERQGDGGVFASSDGGVKWRQTSDGLGGRDVYSLTMTPDDTLLAGTSHGIFRMTNGMWTAASDLRWRRSAGSCEEARGEEAVLQVAAHRSTAAREPSQAAIALERRLCTR